MTTMTEDRPGVTVGIDTHRDTNVAAVLDCQGRLLGTEAFPTTAAGHRALAGWAQGFGPIAAAGVEGTGSWGVGVTRYLTNSGVPCQEVNRPNRQQRRRHGKSDTADAIAAARAVQAQTAAGVPRGNDDLAESLRVNRVAHRSAVTARTTAINQLRSLISTAPDELRARLDGLAITKLVTATARLRPTNGLDPLNATKTAMRSLARRVQNLDAEIASLAANRRELVTAASPPEFLAEVGVGDSVAADLLITIGDNPDRIRTEASFAALCGVSPVDASSGRQHRHRLNRGGDRQANRALWRIVIVRLRFHEPTRDYLERATASGKTKKEAIRCLKRYTARHIWRLLHTPTLDK